MRNPELWLKNQRTMFLEKQNTKKACRQGYQSERRLLVIESDDWGSIRMPSPETYDQIKQRDPRTDAHPFFRYDGLAGEDDLSALYEVLGRYRDGQGHHPVITANCAVANPDFERIREHQNQEYFYEVFTETLARTPGCEHSFELWQQGMQEGMFHPQLHCREHMNVNRWLRDLQAGDSWLQLALAHDMISTASCKRPENENSYMDAFNYDKTEELEQQKAILTDAAKLFRETFGYPSESFIASCYIWGRELEQTMLQNGIRYIQGEPIQHVPSEAEGTADMTAVHHYTGDRNAHGQIYLVRNANFEPSFNPGKDWVRIAMNSIDYAFAHQSPAIVCSHRLNYIGRIQEENRTRNLKLLDELLHRVVSKWPEVEFVTSDELGRIIANEQKI